MTMAAPTLQERVARRIDYVRARQDLQRDLERVLSSGTRPPAHPRDIRIGIAALSSGPWHLVLEILLAHALQMRGAATQLLLCDLPDLPICNERLVTARSLNRCAGCIDDKRTLLDASGLQWEGLARFAAAGAIARARDTVAALRDDELRSYRDGEWPLGEWLDVSASHHLRRDGSGHDAEQVATRRRLLVSAIVTASAVHEWLDQLRPTVVIVQGGVHFMWRIVWELARARGIAVVSREMGKGGWDHHLYALNRDSMAPDLDEAWQIAQRAELTLDESAAVDAFLEQLPARTFPGAAPVGHSPAISTSPDRRTLVAFTNVTWDMATAQRDVGFDGHTDWLRETVRICSELPNARLIVRVHPAEAGNTREPAEDILRKWQCSTDAVTVVPARDAVSAAALCERADMVMVYNSTVGIEAAARGSTVLLAGDPHYRGRGFTIDVDSRGQYRQLLDAWAGGTPPGAPANARQLARRYFHMFYLRYHVPLGWTTSPLEPPFALTIRSLDELAEGRNQALDVVCDGIINQRQVILPRERAGANPCNR